MGAGVPDAPRQLEAHCKSPHCTVISWEEPASNGATIIEYRLEWQQKEEADFTPVRALDKTNTMFNFTESQSNNNLHIN